MHKKMIALAAAGMMAAPLAASAASAEVYGKARISAGFISNDDTGAANDDSKLSVTSHASRLGFRGNEDVGGGLMALWQIEAEINMDDDNNSDLIAGTRNTFVGLGGDFGKVLMGKHDTPYKLATGKLDPFADSWGDYESVVASDNRWSNIIAYMSPEMSGFSLALAYSADTENDDLNTEIADGPGTLKSEKDGTSIAAMYKNGPLFAAVAFESVSKAGAGGDDLENTKLGLGYQIGAAQLAFVYENDDNGGPNNDQDNIYVSLARDMGDDLTLKAALGQKGDVGNAADSGASFYALGVSRALSDKVEAYALYTAVANDKNGTNRLTDGSKDSIYPAAADETLSAFVVGLNLKFSSM